MMKSQMFRLTGAVLITFCAALAAFADIKITTRTTVSGQAIEGTTYIKGARQRVEQNAGAGMKIATIYQCDLKRMLMVNDNARRYNVTMLDENGTPLMTEVTEGASTTETRRGGNITYTFTITDTGQRKQMFGYTARYLKTSMTSVPDANACDQTRMRMETEGWYIDLQYGMGCATEGAGGGMQRRPSRGCQDRVQLKRVGTGKMGYPVSVKTTMYDESGAATMTMTTEVIDLSNTTLDAALFDAPAGYTEVKSLQDLYAVSAGGAIAGPTNNRQQQTTSMSDDNTSTSTVASKPAGTIRVGVVIIGNRTDRQVSVQALRQSLIGAISGSNVDAVPLDATSNIEAEARQKQCDFILYTDIVSLKKSAARSVGGLLGRAAGIGSGGLDKTESRIEFKLIPVGSTAAQLESATTGKEEGDEASVTAALKREAQMVVKEAAKKK